jgi:hypothetical protein
MVGIKLFYFTLCEEELDILQLSGLTACCGSKSGIGMKPVRFEFSNLATVGEERKISRPPISPMSFLVIVCCQRLSVLVRVSAGQLCSI